MMAETEVSKEVSKVAGVEEECRLDMSSYQDLPKPDCNGTHRHNQGNDLDNSYVFVTGADGLPDDSVGDKDASAFVGSNVSPESKAVSVEEQGTRSDPHNEELELSNGQPPEVNDSTSKHESSFEDENIGKSEIMVDCGSEVKQVKDPDGMIGSSAESTEDKVAVRDAENRAVAADEKEKLDDLIESESTLGPVENKESHFRGLELVAESGENRDLESAQEVNSSVNANANEDQINLSTIGSTEECQRSEHVVVNAVDSKLQHVSTEAKDDLQFEREVKNAEREVPPSTFSDLDLESYPINDKEDSLKEESGENGEADIILNSGNANDVVVNGNANDVVVNVGDCEVQDVGMEVKDEIELKSDVVETAETSSSLDLDLKLYPENEKEHTLGEESGDNGELNITSSSANDEGEVPINLNVIQTSEARQGIEDEVVDVVECQLQPGDNGELNITSSNGNDECEDPINLSLIETSQAHQETEDEVVDVVECQLQDAGTEAKDDIKLETEVMSTVEHEVPSSTSLDLDLKSYLINNKEEILEESGENRELIIASNINNSRKANDECEVQITLNASEASQRSKDEVVNVADCELKYVKLENQDEIKLDTELVETAEKEVLASTSSDLQLESHPVTNEEQKLEEAKTASSSALLQSQQSDTTVDNNVQGVLGKKDEAKPVTTNTERHLDTVGYLVSEEKSMEGFFGSDVENGVQYPEEPVKHLDDSGLPSETTLSETKTEASVPTQSFPTSIAYEPQTETEIPDAETIGVVPSSPIDVTKLQMFEGGLPSHDSLIRHTDDAGPESESTHDTVVLAEKEPMLQGGETDTETKVSSEIAKAADSTPEAFDVKLEPEVHDHNVSATSSVETTDNVTLECRTEVSDSFSVEKGAANNVLEIRDVEEMGDQFDGAAESNNANLFLQENEEGNNISVAGPLVEAASIKTRTKPFNFLIRIPRFDDEYLREQIMLAKLHVDEKTKLRDAIQIQIQDRRANNQIHGIDYEYAKGEGRSARKLVREKRMEIDSLQSVINKAKNALSIEDIDRQICNMEHMIQHETLALKEEKQLVREIKQLKQLREQLSSNMGSQAEIKQALEQREEFEERVKILRKELDILKGRVLKAEAVAREAENKYDEENKKVKELQTQFRAADDVRQAAYAQWQSLRKELTKKNKFFFKYKDDAALASNFAFTRDTEALYRLCTNHVENFMELWNTNDDFRREYIKFNARSTVKRLGTLDGRALGPDEESPILPSYYDQRAKMVSAPVKVDLATQIPTPELKQETSTENLIVEGTPMKKVTEHKNQKVINKEPATPVHLDAFDIDSGRDITVEVHEEEPKKSREEIESIRKAEEKRREKAEAELKEQRRLEALAKANEARERKKRQAEKEQKRAELKTQKEAEQREKEREKRLRKKERKKAADVNDIKNETGPTSESVMEISKDIVEVKDNSSVAPKKPQKSWLFSKQSKTKSIPPPFRSRNKKRWQQWMWVIFTSAIILILFWLGNIGVFSNVHSKRRSPII